MSRRTSLATLDEFESAIASGTLPSRDSPLGSDDPGNLNSRSLCNV